jgi:hypothetical protein
MPVSLLKVTMNHIDPFFAGLMGLYVLIHAYQFLRYGSLGGARLGARILKTLGEVEFGQRGMTGSRLRVLRLKGQVDREPTIAIDSVVPFLAPYAIAPLSLTRAQATALGRLLMEAGVDEAQARE